MEKLPNGMPSIFKIGKESGEPTVLFEAVFDYYLWSWHSYFKNLQGG